MTLRLNGSTSGYVEVDAPAVSDNSLVTLPTGGGTLGRMVLETVKASTSGTAIDFTGIPSWVKRITVMFRGVSTNGTSSPAIQLGTSVGIETTNYLGACLSLATAGNGAVNHTSGFILGTVITAAASSVRHGSVVLTNISDNTWTAQGVMGSSEGAYAAVVGGSKTLSATLDRVRITTVNGADTFDAGTINLLLEG